MNQSPRRLIKTITRPCVFGAFCMFVFSTLPTQAKDFLMTPQSDLAVLADQVSAGDSIAATAKPK